MLTRSRSTAGERRELGPVVAAERLLRIAGRDARRPAGRRTTSRSEHVGEVLLALVVLRWSACPSASRSAAASNAYTPALISLIASCSGVASRCSTIAATRPCVVAHDAAQTERIVDLARSARWRPPAAARGRRAAPVSVCRSQQRRVAVRPRRRCRSRPGRHPARSVRRGRCPAAPPAAPVGRPARPRPDVRGDLLGAVTDHDDAALGAAAASAACSTWPSEGAPEQRMQHLRQWPTSSACPHRRRVRRPYVARSSAAPFTCRRAVDGLMLARSPSDGSMVARRGADVRSSMPRIAPGPGQGRSTPSTGPIAVPARRCDLTGQPRRSRPDPRSRRVRSPAFRALVRAGRGTSSPGASAVGVGSGIGTATGVAGGGDQSIASTDLTCGASDPLRSAVAGAGATVAS